MNRSRLPGPIPADLTPEELLERWCRKRDPSALADLFDQVAPGLFRLALTLEPDAAAAEDALQETFLVAVEGAHRWDGERPVIPWLVGVLRHKLHEGRRARRRVPRRERFVEPPPPEDPAALAESAELRERLHLAMEALPEPYREAAILRWRHGLEPAEIAALKNVAPGTVWSWLHRALSRLRAGSGALAGVAIGTKAPRGVNAVREAVIRIAVESIAVPATATIALGGALMTLKTVLSVGIVAVLAAGGWWLFMAGHETEEVTSTVASGLDPGGDPVATGTEPAPAADASGIEVPPGDVAPAPGAPPPVDLDACDRDLDLFGVVVDPAGKPVPAARIEATGRPFDMMNGLPEEVRSREERGPSTVSSTDGSFRLRLHRGARVDLRVDAPPFAELILPDRPAGARLRIVLPAASSLRVMVKDELGQPVPGVTVQLLRTKELPLPLIHRQAITDAFGACDFERLTPGRVALRAWAEGFGRGRPKARTTLEQGRQEWEVVLTRGRTVRGEVLDDANGHGITGAQVCWSPVEGAAVSAGDGGEFELPGWDGAPGSELYATAAGFGVGRALISEEGKALIRLARATVLRGRVVDAKGGALPGVELLLGAAMSAAVTTSAGDGTFEIESDLREGLATLQLALAGHGTVLLPLKNSTEARVDLGDIPLGPSRTIEGRVLDVEGAPIEGAPVIAEPVVEGLFTPREFRRIGWTDDLGRFRFIDRSPGTWRVAILPDGAAAPVETTLVVERDRDPPSVTLRPVAARDVAVKVVDAAGHPLRDVMVGVRRNAQEPGRMMEAGNDGTVTLPSVAREPTRVTAWHSPRGARSLGRKEVELGADVDALTIVLAPTASIEGRVVGPDGAPVQGLPVEARPAGDTKAVPLGIGVTGTDRSFRIDLPAGTRVDLRLPAMPPALSKDPWRGTLPDVASPAKDLVIRARRATPDRSLRVEVFDPDGVPMAKANLHVFGGGPPRPAVTGSDGTATIDGLFGDPLDLMATPSTEGGSAAEFIPPPSVHIPEGEGTVTLRFRRGVPLHGRVVDASGAPVTGGMCMAQFADGSHSLSHVDDQGRFVISVLPGEAVKSLTTTRNGPDGREIARAALVDLPAGSDDVVLRFEAGSD